MVTVELTYGSDVARASNQVDAALSRIEGQLPEDADPQVISGGTSDLPAVVLSVSSDLDPSELATRLESSVTPELERVSGVSSPPWTPTGCPCPAAPSPTATAPWTSCWARAWSRSRASSRSC